MTDRTSGRSRPRDDGGAGRERSSGSDRAGPGAGATRPAGGGSGRRGGPAGNGRATEGGSDRRAATGRGGTARPARDDDGESDGRTPRTPAGGGTARGSGTTRGGGSGRAGDAPADSGRLEIAELSIVPSVPGVHPLAAVGVAAGLTALGVVVDLLRIGTLGTVFTVCYLTGCVLGVAWVRREGLFWPMVVPPLLMAAAVPVVVLVAGSPPPGAGVAQRLLQIGAPLVNGFPMMAWTTGLALLLGVFRLITQRLRPGRGAARGEGRTSGSPRRS